MTKAIATILLIGGILFAISRGCFHIYVHYQYVNEIGSKWELSDRASTIVQKYSYCLAVLFLRDKGMRSSQIN